MACAMKMKDGTFLEIHWNRKTHSKNLYVTEVRMEPPINFIV
jgi:hypothetical protein